MLLKSDNDIILEVQMELRLLNSNKLKVMLSEKDLSDYSLSCETIDYANTETRKAFWSIFDEAKHQTGFDAAKEKVYIQVYPKTDGGCEMYVTKLGLEGPNREISVERPKKEKEGFFVYSFPTYEAMEEAYRALENAPLMDRTENKYFDGCSYYLAVSCKYGNDEIDGPVLLCEFGEEIDGDFFLAYAGEYCKSIL
ncbi:MAG: adaptor protein MecA [Ruminococcaceae bacterium]|nr:adaptor protein MecA [Oscillospiraceae bacterium]